MERSGGVSVYKKKPNESIWSSIMSLTDIRTTPISTDIDVSVSSKKSYVTTMNSYSLFKNAGASSATLKLSKAGSYFVVLSPYSGGYYSSGGAIGIATSSGNLYILAGNTTTWGMLSISGNTITVTSGSPVSVCAIYIAPPGAN